MFRRSAATVVKHRVMILPAPPRGNNSADAGLEIISQHLGKVEGDLPGLLTRHPEPAD